MAFVRLFVLWLLVAAVPLQSIAAGSMLFCGAEASGGGPHSRGTTSDAGHMHEHEGHFIDEAAGSSAQSDDVQADHRCSVCASCCHPLGIAPDMRSEVEREPATTLFASVLAHVVDTIPARLERPPRG
jgi:hypothetical protein